jgi:hypothetical protein
MIVFDAIVGLVLPAGNHCMFATPNFGVVDGV